MDNELFEYQFNETGVTITKYTGDRPVVDIPSEIDGKPVTEIGKDAFKKCDFVKAVHIPDTVELISEFAFADCSSLKEIIIPDSVKRINYHAFNEALTSVILPENFIDAGQNFKNTIEVISECGHYFRINPQSSYRAVCPCCGSMNYAVPGRRIDIFWAFILFVIACIAEVILFYWMMETFSFWIGGILASYTLFRLISQCEKWSCYQTFKSTINPELAKKGRTDWENNLMKGPQDGMEEDASSELQPLPEYHHRNVSVGYVVIPLYVLMAALAVALPILNLGDPEKFMEALTFSALFSLFWVGMYYFVFSRTYPPLRLILNDEGIQSTKWKPKMLPWENIKQFEVIMVTSSFRAGMVVKFVLKDRKKRKLALTFGSMTEAKQCLKVFMEFVSRHNPELLETAKYKQM